VGKEKSKSSSMILEATKWLLRTSLIFWTENRLEFAS
jgi:hypothetical protein